MIIVCFLVGLVALIGVVLLVDLITYPIGHYLLPLEEKDLSERFVTSVFGLFVVMSVALITVGSTVIGELICHLFLGVPRE